MTKRGDMMHVHEKPRVDENDPEAVDAWATGYVHGQRDFFEDGGFKGYNYDPPDEDRLREAYDIGYGYGYDVTFEEPC